MPLAWDGSSRTSVVDMAVVLRSQAIHGSDRGQTLYMLGVLVAAHLRNTVYGLHDGYSLFFPKLDQEKRKAFGHATNGTVGWMMNYQTN